MNDEKLIEFVKENSVLYNVSMVKYNDAVHKFKIWKDIAKKLNQPSSVCKSRWNNIRDNYRKSVKKRLTTERHAPNSGNKKKYYKYEEQLRFLDNFYHKSMLDVEDEADQEYLMGEDDPLDDLDSEALGHSQSSRCNKTFVNSNSNRRYYSSFTSFTKPMTAPIPATVTPPPIDFIKLETSKSAAPSSANVLNKDESQSANSLQAKAVDAFLAGLSSTLKSFTPYYLNLVKSKIFSAVQEYEMAMILENNEQIDLKSEHESHTLSSLEPSLLPQCILTTKLEK
ncbi:uncharacterized protein LOC143913173 [Arctopsyche grandis]|uniref:uncharacterized protein LOC143913173 n=1 Tax=Arctopsyche grandis TaxID=121162 RepID=UPI00406D6C35